MVGTMQKRLSRQPLPHCLTCVSSIIAHVVTVVNPLLVNITNLCAKIVVLVTVACILPLDTLQNGWYSGC